MGHFEHGLIYFHRGHAIRPELDEFSLGIQKCQEAIENSVGSEYQTRFHRTIRWTSVRVYQGMLTCRLQAVAKSLVISIFNSSPSPNAPIFLF